MTKKDFPVIPGYIIKEKLGEGGMANVYLALQENLGREVAIKILDPLFLKDRQALKRFKIEAQTAAKLIHPNIITVYDVGQSGDNHYIVMEYLKESLRDRIKAKGKLPTAETLGIIKKIADALSHAHNKSIIHRDIKPDNIMFRPDGSPVLLDFGIARALDINTRLTLTGMSIGTPHYMSPEQCRGEELDGRSDIYSLGAVLFELLTGNIPYKSETPAGLLYLHTHGPIPKLPEELIKYQPLIDTMMAKKKDERVKNGAELVKYTELLEKEKRPIRYNKSIFRYLLPPVILSRFRVTIIVVTLGIVVYFSVGPGSKEKTATPGEVKESILEKKAPSKKMVPPPTEQETPGSSQKAKKIKNSEEIDPVKEETKIKKSKKKTSNAANISKQRNKPGRSKKETKAIEMTPTRDEALKKEEKEEKDKIEEEKSVVKAVNFVNLSREVIVTMNKTIKRIEILNIEEGITAGGEIELNLSVDEKGRIQIKHLDDSRLIVNREDKKEMVKRLIAMEIGQISFEPLKDETGEPQKIENWRKKYKLGTFQGKIILY